MTDPHPITADPTPGPPPLPAPAPEPLPLADLYSAGFDGEHLKLLRINIHKQLIRAGRVGVGETGTGFGKNTFPAGS